MDDDAQHEAELRELTRLLGTAKDEERRDVIRKAINALEAQAHSATVSKNDKFSPIGSGNYAHLMQKIPLDKMKAGPGSGGARPLSARNRSTSNLEVIHENASHLAEARRIAQALPISPIPENCTYIRLSTQDSLSCSKLKLDHVAEISASCFDPRFPVANIAPGSSSKNPFWVSTGLLPHTVTIQLHESWLIRQVEVPHEGVKKLSITFGDSLRRPGASHMMMSENSSFFYSDTKDDSGALSARPGDSTNMISLMITEIDGLFFSLGGIKVFAERDSNDAKKRGGTGGSRK